MATVEANSDPAPAPVMAQELNSATIGAIVGVATAMLATLIALVYILVRQRRRHQRGMADLEERANAMRGQHAQAAQMNGVPITRLRNVLRRATFLPFGSRVGWDTLESREDVSRAQQHDTNMPTSVFTRPVRAKKRESKCLSWPFSRQPTVPNVVVTPIPMQGLEQSRLSTVVESPVPAPLQSQRITRGSSDARQSNKEIMAQRQERTIRRIESVSDLRPDPLTVGKKRMRAKTMTALSTMNTPKTEPAKVNKRPRPVLHARSFSLGSKSPGSVPQHAVPPLPLTVRNVDNASRPERCYTRNNNSQLSVSSLESIGSSVLASPRLHRSASERSARLQHVARRSYGNSLISGPRPLRPKVNNRPQSSPEHNLYMQSLRGSIKSNVDSMHSDGQRPLSAISAASNGDALAVQTSEALRPSHVSLTLGGTPYQGNITPRRQSRLMVSENGSPTVQRVAALREIAGNAALSRQLSQTSTDASSTRSSNGNPFQFDPSPMASGKPSALKGSPNARVRHTRSLQVRINIRPQVMNASRGSSPIMADILEESPENVTKVPQLSSSMGPLPRLPSSPRPPSTSTFEPQLKVRPLSFVASLTADSPTLSSMKFLQDNRRLSTTSTRSDRSMNRVSFSSLHFPSFPSPEKARLTTNIMPTPTFSYTRPSNELERDDSPSTEAIMLLAKPYGPRGQESPTLPSTEYDESDSRKASIGSTTGELIFPTLEKEHMKAADPPFDYFMKHDDDLAASPPCSPITSPSNDVNLSPSFTSQSQKILHSTEPQESTSPPLSAKSPRPVTFQIHCEDEFGQSERPSVSGLDLGVRVRSSSSSTIPGLNIYHSPLLSPTQIDPPATNLCLSIVELRRMNSDAKHDAQNPKLKAARRFQQMGRGESPRVASRDSVESLCEIDDALDNGVSPCSENTDDDSIIYGKDADEDAGEDADEDADEGANKENMPLVWEAGETCWMPKSRPELARAPFSPVLSSSRNVSPLSASSVNVQCRGNMGIQSPLAHRRVSEMRGSAIMEKLPVALSGLGNSIGTPRVVIQPPSSEMGSPATSLYDATGFLK